MRSFIAIKTVLLFYLIFPLVILAQANGGTESNITFSGTTYRLHTFTTSGTLNISSDITAVEYLIVGGGGGGGGNGGGGGGGGSVMQGTFTTLSSGTYSITVGSSGSNSSGGSSSLNHITAAGGGVGQSSASGMGGDSGGPGGGQGGNGNGSNGGNGTSSSITGVSLTYGGGGGGGGISSGGSGNVGGNGGTGGGGGGGGGFSSGIPQNGGTGGSTGSDSGENGKHASAGGHGGNGSQFFGGGGGGGGTGGNGGNGGSGIVIIRYVVMPCVTATRLYVNHAATGNNTGESWTNAFTDLQDALDCATAGKEIWVAQGTYLPTDAPDGTTSNGATDRNNAFHLDKDLKIYGGFTGTESMLSERDWGANPTILSGDFSGDDVVTGSGSSLSITNNSENAYHVMITAGLSSSTIIDGFTLSGGNADGSGPISYSSVLFYLDRGGGQYNSSSSPSLTNVTFSGNTAGYGGGQYNNSSSPSLTNVTFSGNTASNNGGGQYNQADPPSLTNVTFYKNTAGDNGGGQYNIFTTPSLYNTLFYGNTASSTGPDIYGNINPSSSYNASDGTGGEIDTGTGFVDLSSGASTTLFVNAADPDGADNKWMTADDGLVLATGSALLATGSPTIAPTTDIVGAMRPNPPSIGAYEAMAIGTTPDTTISLVGGVLSLTDSGSSSNDRLTFTVSGTLLRIHDPNNVLDVSGAGVMQVDDHTVTVPLASLTAGIAVDTGTGSDTLNWNAPLALTGTASLSIKGATTLTQNASITFENGGVSYQVSGTITLSDGAFILGTGTGNVVLLTEANILINASIRNTAATNGGAIIIVSGWDGSTAFDATTFDAINTIAALRATTLFGQSSSTITIGDGSQISSVTVGSRTGPTRLYGFDLALEGGSGGNSRFAQLGFTATNQGNGFTISGTIILRMRNSIALNGGSSGEFNYAQIGHIGGDISPKNSTIDARVTGTIRLALVLKLIIQGGATVTSYAQLGHGGRNASGVYEAIYVLLTPEIQIQLQDNPTGVGLSRLGNDEPLPTVIMVK